MRRFVMYPLRGWRSDHFSARYVQLHRELCQVLKYCTRHARLEADDRSEFGTVLYTKSG